MLIKRKPQVEDPVAFNRMLLEDAYPHEIAKHHYGETFAKYENVRGLDAYDFLREEKYCRVEIDITGGTKEELLAGVESVIDHMRETIRFKHPDLRGPLVRECDLWTIFDQVEKNGKNFHQIAREILDTLAIASEDKEVDAMVKKVTRAYKKAKQMVEDIYRTS